MWYYHGLEEEEHVEFFEGWMREQLQPLIKASLGKRAVGMLEQFKNVESDVASLVHVSTSGDGTTKLLLRLASDGLEVETVIIPWSDRKRSTLCIS